MTTMSRSSTPWDEPDTDHHTPALPDAAEVFQPTESPDIMSSVDSARSQPEFVIADVSREDAWVSVDESDATVLEEWC